MQMLHVTGFLNRVVYNACRAYVGSLKKGAAYGDMVNVMAVSICDFVLWPDAERDALQQPRVPMVSRWSMSEHVSGARSLGQVQYVFMELRKQGDKVPGTANERWASLFSHAQDLEPDSVREVSLTVAQREALELAREEHFTQAELDAIARAHEEVDQVRRTIATQERARLEAESRATNAEAKAADAEAKAASEAKARADAEAKVESEAKARADAEAKVESEAKARADAEARIRELEALLATKRSES
jgi:hypothetical protein